MRIARQQARMGNGASPFVRSAEILLRRILRVSGGVCAALAAAVLSGSFLFEAWWEPESAAAWRAHLGTLGAWVFLQMTALALFSAGLSRFVGRRCP